ncbi:hypothetical protein ACFQX7_22180 [Luedemannella flava]
MRGSPVRMANAARNAVITLAISRPPSMTTSVATDTPERTSRTSKPPRIEPRVP